MSIIDKPRVYVVARQYLDSQQVKQFLSDEHTSWETDAFADDSWPAPGDGEFAAELGGRLCYLSFGKNQYRKNNPEYITNIIRQQHFSVLEHAVWTFIITGVSRSLTHELIRHRHLSPSQLSQRYVDESTADMVIPPFFSHDDELRDMWKAAVDQAHQAYVALVDRASEKYPELGNTKRERRIAVRQAARSVLPNATETKIQITANATAIRHVLHMRGSLDAEAEIRRLAIEWAKVMKKEAPAIFADCKIVGSGANTHIEFVEA